MVVKLLRPLFDMLTPENVKECSLEQQRQFMVVVSLILISIFFLVTLGVVTTIQNATHLSVIDFGLAVVFIGLGIILKETGKVKEISSILISVLAIFFYYLFFYGGLERTTWVWYFTFPLWAIFLKGKQTGTALSLLLIGATIATYIFTVNVTQDQFYSTNMIIRLTSAYLCIVFITYVMEDTRVTTHNRLLATNEALNAMVDELNTARGQLHELSIKDSLTGLFNRRHFDEVLTLSIAHSNRYDGSMALLMLDLDYFKNYNDQYGHPSGDMVLKRFSRLLSSIIRREADTICRYGGEEFAIILNNCKPGQVEKICDSLIRSTRCLDIPHKRSPFKYVTTSIGAISIPSNKNNLSPSEMLKRADHQLYLAKQQGRNRVVIEHDEEFKSEVETIITNIPESVY